MSNDGLIDALHDDVDHLRCSVYTAHEVRNFANEEGEMIRVIEVDVQVVRGRWRRGGLSRNVQRG